MITLEQIKELPLNSRALYHVKNLRLFPEYENLEMDVRGITGWENQNPYPNEDILVLSRALYETGLYLDSEWKAEIIPEINEAIEFNKTFVRWLPGYLVKKRKDVDWKEVHVVDFGTDYAIVAYDFGFVNEGSRNYKSFKAYYVDDNGDIDMPNAWENYDNYELVDTEHVKENLIKIMEYEMGIRLKRY